MLCSGLLLAAAAVAYEHGGDAAHSVQPDRPTELQAQADQRRSRDAALAAEALELAQWRAYDPHAVVREEETAAARQSLGNYFFHKSRLAVGPSFQLQVRGSRCAGGPCMMCPRVVPPRTRYIRPPQPALLRGPSSEHRPDEPAPPLLPLFLPFSMWQLGTQAECVAKCEAMGHNCAGFSQEVISGKVRARGRRVGYTPLPSLSSWHHGLRN